MWAQLIKVRLKPGKDLAVPAAQLRAAEQPGSGLVREMFMRDQMDPAQAYILAVLENEEQARARAGPAPSGRTARHAGDDGRHTRRPARVHRLDRRRRVDGLAEPRMLTATAAASTGWTEAVAKPEETSGPTSFGSGIP